MNDFILILTIVDKDLKIHKFISEKIGYIYLMQIIDIVSMQLILNHYQSTFFGNKIWFSQRWIHAVKRRVQLQELYELKIIDYMFIYLMNLILFLNFLLFFTKAHFIQSQNLELLNIFPFFKFHFSHGQSSLW